MEPRPVQYQISVTARASFNGTNYPDMVLAIDGVTVGSALVESNNPVDYAFSADLTAGVAHTVSILYPNSTSSGELLDSLGIRTSLAPCSIASRRAECSLTAANAKCAERPDSTRTSRPGCARPERPTRRCAIPRRL